MHHALFFIVLGLASAFFALMEIQIEGPNGWAENLPTWRPVKKPWWGYILYGKKPVTGYHLCMNAVVLCLVHMPLAYDITWDFSRELQALSFLAFFFVLEDFLWFVLNPHFGLKKFRPEYIWWHRPTWLWIMPGEYYWGIPIGAGLYWLHCWLD